MKMVSNIKSTRSIITGDFIYNLFNVSKHSETEEYYNNMICNSFKPTITKPTRITDTSKTLIDHIWTNDMNEDNFNTKILISDITDHLPIMYIKYTKFQIAGYTTINYRPITKNNMIKFKMKLDEYNDEFLFCLNNANVTANEKANNYFDIFGKLYNDCFPVKSKKYTIRP